MVEINKDKDLAEVKIRYGLALLKNEIYKMLIMFVFYLCIGKLPEYLFSLVILLPIRIYSGGLHMKSNLGCFAFSFIFTMLAICILPAIQMSFYSNLCLSICSFVIIAVCSPFSSPKKPITTVQRYRFFKLMSCIFSAIESIIVMIMYSFGNLHIAQVGIWIIFLQALQLLLAQIFKKWRKTDVQEN